MFPSFSNKITWSVVLTGLTLLAPKTWLEQILFEFLNINLNLNISSSSDNIFGVLLVIIGLTYNYFSLREKTKQEQVLSKRPDVFAYIDTVAAGNMATVFNLEVKNSGSSIAKNIKLLTNEVGSNLYP